MNSLEKHCGFFFFFPVTQSHTIKYYPAVGLFPSWLRGNTTEGLATDSK